MSKKQKVEKIIGLFKQIYVFEKEVIDELTERIVHMNDEGLDKLLITLEAGIEDQTQMLKKWTTREPDFARGLSDFVNKTSKKLIHEYEKTEKESAENILNELA